MKGHQDMVGGGGAERRKEKDKTKILYSEGYKIDASSIPQTCVVYTSCLPKCP